MKLKIKKENGITLIALIITIIILLILAGVTISTLEKTGILKTAEITKEKQNAQEAREKLELFLLNAKIEKETNTSYNDEYLNNMLEKQGITVYGDYVIINNYHFLIDREQLKILDELGKTQIKVTTEVKEYLGKNSNDKYEVSLLLIVESNSIIESATITNPDGTTFELETEKVKITKNMIVELDEEYTVTIATKDGKIANKKIVEKSQTTIGSLQEFIDFRNKVNSGLTYEGETIALTQDLDLSSVCGENIGNWEPISKYESEKTNYFKGIFEGNNHKIINLYINSSDVFQGLFGYNIGTIQNLSIENGYIETSNRGAGFIVGINEGKIKNITTRGTISGYVGTGSTVGYNYNEGILEHCINYATVTYNAKGSGSYGWQTGGICGFNANAIIEKCINYGNVIGTHSAGGIVGEQNRFGEIKLCANYGTITGDKKVYDNWMFIGGIAGGNGYDSKGTIINCYNAGEVTSKISDSYIGGISGNVVGGSSGYSIIENCYNIGKITISTNKGGILGRLDSAGGNNTVTNNYWLDSCGTTYGRATEKSNINAVLKNDDELKVLALELGDAYVDDTTNINEGYPVLKWMTEYFK